MKKRAIEIGCDLLLFFKNHCAIVAIAMTLTAACKYDAPLFGVWMALLGIPLYLYITRKNVQNFFLFFFVQLLPVAVACMVSAPIGIKLIALCMTVFYVISSIKIRLAEIPQEVVFMPVVSIAIFGGAHIVEELFLKNGWGHYYFFLTFMYVIAYFFYYFLEQYLNFVLVNKNSASNIPEAEIFRSGMKQTGVYVACGVAVMLLSVNVEWLTYIIKMVGRGLLAVIRFLMSFLVMDTTETEPAQQAQGNSGGMQGFLEKGEAHPFWIFLEKVLMAAAFVGIVVAIIVGLVKGYQFLRKNFRKIEKKKQEVQNGLDIRESCEIERGSGEHSRWFSFLNNTDKIRKMYRKRVLKSKALIVGASGNKELEYLTAKECCDKISADSLKEIYEKARYSNENITADDVKNVKASIKKDM